MIIVCSQGDTKLQKIYVILFLTYLIYSSYVSPWENFLPFSHALYWVLRLPRFRNCHYSSSYAIESTNQVFYIWSVWISNVWSTLFGFCFQRKWSVNCITSTTHKSCKTFMCELLQSDDAKIYFKVRSRTWTDWTDPMFGGKFLRLLTAINKPLGSRKP